VSSLPSFGTHNRVTYTIPPESLAAQVAYCEASVQYTASETGILRQASKRGSIETLARDYATHMLITAANTIAARIDVIREIGIKQPTAEVSHSVHVGSAKTVFLNTMTRSWCGELARACNRTITTYVRERSCVCVCVCVCTFVHMYMRVPARENKLSVLASCPKCAAWLRNDI